MEPQIIFEDEFLLVIDKPSGMIVNRADTTASVMTVQDWVGDYLKVPRGDEASRVPQARDTRGTFDSRDTFCERAGIVHRLDKETSGLLLIAKTPEAFVNLQAQFKNREVKKKYLALVHEKVMPEEGEINAPVGRLPWNRERFGVMPGGKEARTLYKIYKYYNGYTLLELSPLTGRTHQIRIHLQYLGFPIVGDTFYAGRKQAAEDRKFCPRVFLHASKISFKHPMSGKMMEFNAALPEELQKIVELLNG